MHKKTYSKTLTKKVHSFLYYRERATKILKNLVLRYYCVYFFSLKKNKIKNKKIPYNFFQNVEVLENYLNV